MSLRRMLGRGPLGNAGWFSVCSRGGCPERDAKHTPRPLRPLCVWLCVAKMRDGDETGGRIRSMARGPSAFTPCRAIRPEIRKNRKEEWSNSRNPLIGRGTKFGHTQLSAEGRFLGPVVVEYATFRRRVSPQRNPQPQPNRAAIPSQGLASASTIMKRAIFAIVLCLFTTLIPDAEAQYYRRQRRDDASFSYTRCPTCGDLVYKADIRAHRMQHEQENRNRREAAEEREMRRRREERDAVQASRAADTERILGMKGRVDGVIADWMGISTRLAEPEYQSLIDGDGTNLLRSASSAVRTLRATYAEAEGAAARETTAESRRALIRQSEDAVQKAETEIRRVREYKRRIDSRAGRMPIPDQEPVVDPPNTSDEPERMPFSSVMVLRREDSTHFVCKRPGAQGDPFLIDLSMLPDSVRSGLSQGKRVSGIFFRYGRQTATATYQGAVTEMPLLVFEREE